MRPVQNKSLMQQRSSRVPKKHAGVQTDYVKILDDNEEMPYLQQQQQIYEQMPYGSPQEQQAAL